MGQDQDSRAASLAGTYHAASGLHDLTGNEHSDHISDHTSEGSLKAASHVLCMLVQVSAGFVIDHPRRSVVLRYSYRRSRNRCFAQSLSAPDALLIPGLPAKADLLGTFAHVIAKACCPARVACSIVRSQYTVPCLAAIDVEHSLLGPNRQSGLQAEVSVATPLVLLLCRLLWLVSSL